MKIIKIESLPNVNKFKNKEDFCNRLIQKVMSISKKSLAMEGSNKKINEVIEYRNKLITKSQKLDNLLEKSKDMKKDLTEKIDVLIESNNKYRNRLLEMLGSGGI